ncbi:hypothetical protein AC249_AIPGENE22621 [Exaiptasia diaphana]|nr:hypothetical protein AC249_AIPGENE22621 [Exaiptasia diaphana]
MSRKRLKPFSFDATFVDKSGKKSKKTFSLTAEPKLPTGRRNEKLATEIVQPFSFEELDISGSGLSSYEKRQISNIQKWDNIRTQLFDAYVEGCCIPTDTTCVYCLQNPATLRCQYCGPKQYFCFDCANILHSARNNFHVLEKWKIRGWLFRIIGLKDPKDDASISTKRYDFHEEVMAWRVKLRRER